LSDDDESVEFFIGNVHVSRLSPEKQAEIGDFICGRMSAELMAKILKAAGRAA
jgi:hypothetical protein